MVTRFAKPIFALLTTLVILALLAIPLGPLPALGPLLSPVGGFWSAGRGDAFGAEEQLHFTALKGEVKVVRDRYGVPHIFAQNDEDAAFVLGYLHARERLAQIDLQRRVASGTLSALVGADALEDDRFMREVGLRRSAQAALEKINADHPALLVMQAYAAGINAYLAAVEPHHLPLEYKLLGVNHVEPWTVLDEMTFAKYMGWDLVHSFDDLYLTTLAEKMGAEKVAELFPLTRPGEEPFIPTWPPEEVHWTPTFAPAPLHEAIASILERAAQAGQLNRPNEWRGSNNWAIGPARSESGKPIFASDPHLGYQLPSLWYVAHIVTPTQNVYGATLAGMPFVVIGHTRNIAWGLTNTQADVMDFFAEKINPENPNQYWHNGHWEDLQVVDEVIEVRGQKPVHHTVRLTAHGPIISQKGYEVALQWTGAIPTFEPIALYKLNHAENYEAFVDGLRYFQVPAQNFAYADREGNIALWSAGLYPIRKKGDGRFILDGASGEYDWTGFVPFEEVPHTLNPAQGYVESANERPTPSSYPYFLGWQWDPNARALRIRQRLEACHPCSVADMQALQYDSKDVYAERLLPLMLAAIQPQNDLQQAALDLLKKWDYFNTTDSIAATLWNRWFSNFRRATWQDDWQAAGFTFNEDGSLKDWEAWGFNGNNEYQPPLEYWMWLVENQPTSPYFDDQSTGDRIEARDDLIRLSFEKTLSELQQELGAEMNRWQFGTHHVLKVPHLLDVPVLNRGGQPIPGNSNSPNGQSNFGPSDGGPSWRMIVDFADPAHSFGVYPGGQSGWPLSPHYDDFIPLWVEGKYFPLLFPTSPQELNNTDIESTLTFIP